MNDKKRVAIIAQGIIPIIDAGAVETLLTSLVKENEVKQACDLTIFSEWDSRAEILSNKYNKTKFRYIKISILDKVIFKLKKYLLVVLKKDRYRIVTPFIYYVYKCLKSEVNNYDYVIIEHGGHLYGYTKLYNILKGKLFYHSHTNEIPKEKSLYDGVICISDYCRQSWLEYFSKDNVLLLRNGIDLTKFQKRLKADERNELRLRLGIKQDDFCVIFCGRLLKVKGILELIRAVNLIDDFSVKLLIVGGLQGMKNPDNNFLLTIHDEADKNPDRIIFTGHIDNGDLYQYYQCADVQVVPSICQEGAGLVAIEGMASGLPLIITKSGGMPEYVTDKCALIVPQGSALSEKLKTAILKLHKDSNLALHLGENGLKRARKLTAGKFYDDFVKLFDNQQV